MGIGTPEKKFSDGSHTTAPKLAHAFLRTTRARGDPDRTTHTQREKRLKQGGGSERKERKTIDKYKSEIEKELESINHGRSMYR